MIFPLAPILYSLELTYECTNKCPACANLWHNQQELSQDLWIRILNYIFPSNDRQKYAELIRVTGGEPTLHKNFSAIIQYIDTFQIPHALLTNGQWANPLRIVELYENCKHFIGMLISLHGHTEDIHWQFVQHTDKKIFKKTCDNISVASKKGLTVYTNTVLTRYSCDHIESIISFSKNLGAECAVFNRLIGPDHDLQPTNEQLKNAVEIIESRPDECRIGNCIPPCFVPNSSECSNAGIEHCAISPDGWVRPDNLTNYVFGNIFNQSIEEIWQSEKAKLYRNFLNKDCLQCKVLSSCRGGERSEIIEYGLSKDRLMKKPITKTKKRSLVLNPYWKPYPLFRIKKSKSGYVITRHNISMPVDTELKPVLECINGDLSIAELNHSFGDSLLKVLGILYDNGYIEFKG